MGLGSVLGVAQLPQAVGHALSHLVVAVPVALLVLWAFRAWPSPPTDPARGLGRRLAVAGLVGIAPGQLLEIIGARVDEPGSSALEAAAHTAGQVVTTISLVLAALGLALVLVAAARDRAIPAGWWWW